MAKRGEKLVALIGLCALSSCLSVRQEDLNAWTGAPVASLDKHPIFLTMPMVRTMAPDGTEIRNYVNGRDVSSCASGGMLSGAVVSFAAYNGFTTCVHAHPACNNIFYIKDGIVIQYSPIGTGGMRCYTNESARPGGATGGANIR